MRDFGPPIGQATYDAIRQAALELYEAIPQKREVPARAFAMEEEPDRIVVTEADLRWPDGRVRVALTKPEARPPFEWLVEITSDVNEADYFKHYLVREDDIVLAQRKVLTPLDDQEAQTMLADLAAAREALKD
jgi:hypothetical protein